MGLFRNFETSNSQYFFFFKVGDQFLRLALNFKFVGSLKVAIILNVLLLQKAGEFFSQFQSRNPASRFEHISFGQRQRNFSILFAKSIFAAGLGIILERILPQGVNAGNLRNEENSEKLESDRECGVCNTRLGNDGGREIFQRPPKQNFESVRRLYGKNLRERECERKRKQSGAKIFPIVAPTASRPAGSLTRTSNQRSISSL